MSSKRDVPGSIRFHQCRGGCPRPPFSFFVKWSPEAEGASATQRAEPGSPRVAAQTPAQGRGQDGGCGSRGGRKRGSSEGGAAALRGNLILRNAPRPDAPPGPRPPPLPQPPRGVLPPGGLFPAPSPAPTRQLVFSAQVESPQALSQPCRVLSSGGPSPASPAPRRPPGLIPFRSLTPASFLSLGLSVLSS